MKIKIWVLSTILCDDYAPALPRVFGSEAEAEAGFNEAMRGEWETHKPEDSEGNPLPYPGNARDALIYLANDNRGDSWGLWELTSHDVEVGAPPEVWQSLAVLIGVGTTHAEDLETGFADGTYDDPDTPKHVEEIRSATHHLLVTMAPDQTVAPSPPTSSDPWEEDDRFPRSDWKLDVANGDTNLGYAEWLMHQREAAATLGDAQ